MNIIITALLKATGFLVLSIPFIILNLYIEGKKHKLLKTKYTVVEKFFTFLLMFTLIIVLSVTIGNNASFSISKASLSNVNFYPFCGMSAQYACAIDGDIYFILNIFGNIFMLTPFGMCLGLYLKDIKDNGVKVALIGAIISLFIETIQLYTGRYADITDIILNTAGVVSGNWLFKFNNILFSDFFDKITLRNDYKGNKKVMSFKYAQILLWTIFLILNIH